MFYFCSHHQFHRSLKMNLLQSQTGGVLGLCHQQQCKGAILSVSYIQPQKCAANAQAYTLHQICIIIRG